MDYVQATEYIHKTLNFGSKPGLERITELCRRLGDPQDRLRIIHVAGTNGKGSTVTMIACALEDAGFKVGKYTSPYVYDFRERIEINGEMISKDDLASIITTVAAQCNEMSDHPTEFEMITAAAFLYFLKEKCDYVVLETGLGGRLDATNTVKAPLVSVICSISLDHVKILGNTVEAIAAEKAGIIKQDCPCAIYPANPESVDRIFENVCKEKNSRLEKPDVTQLKIKSSGNKTLFDYKGVTYAPAMLGKHQIYNALTAITALEVLGISPEFASSGIARAVAHGRYEILCDKPRVILDAGHNRSGIEALLKALKNDKKVKKLTVIFGMLRDKDYPFAIRSLAEIATKMVCVTPDSPRALTANEAKEIAELFCTNCFACDNAGTAVRTALAGLSDGTLLICGSFYIIKNIVGQLNKELEI